MEAHSATTPDRARKLKVLVSAASTHGATSEIAQVIGQALSEHGFAVTVLPPEQVPSVDGYDAVIIGSAGLHRPLAGSGQRSGDPVP